MAEPFTVLIMAAGRGTRMRSETPKVLHPICGKPMVEWIIDAAREAGAQRIVCVTRPGDGVEPGLPEGVVVAEQQEGEGTGAAVLAAREELSAGGGPVVVLSGDHPLVSAAEIAGLVAAHRADGSAATLLTTETVDPAGYGRIIRGPDGSFERIVETKYPEGVPPEELAIREINVGTYAFDPVALVDALDEVVLQDGEHYLTGAFPVILAHDGRIGTHLTADPASAFGVNDREQLMHAEDVAQMRILEGHARNGTTFQAPRTIRVDTAVRLGQDVVVGPGCSLLGSTTVGAGAQLGPHCTLIDSVVGEDAAVVQSYLHDAEVQAGATVGPFAYLRPGAVVGEGAKVGTFVEIKNSRIGAGAKVPHLSYVGDADVGEEANLGASTITANYDGREKHRTKLGKRVKTGVHTSLVAPVDVGDRAYTGAGSVIDEDVPEGALGIARSRQRNVDGYADRVEEEPE